MADFSDKEQIVKVVIFGEEYAVRGTTDPEFIMRVAEAVDKKMRDIALRSKNRSPKKIAVLAALNFAGELLDLEDKSEIDLSRTEDKAKGLLSLLDSALPASENN
jgi:cell division protein ZapA